MQELGFGGCPAAVPSHQHSHTHNYIYTPIEQTQQVDRGSDDDASSLVEGLPLTDNTAAALERAARQAPYCRVSQLTASLMWHAKNYNNKTCSPLPACCCWPCASA